MTIFRNTDTEPEQRNWAGNIRFRPAAFQIPSSERTLSNVLKKCHKSGTTVRAVGARHSCSPLIETDDVLVSLEKFKKFRGLQHEKKEATFDAGMTIEEVGQVLFRHGLAMENTGHIDQQALGGAISTGTHGAGKHLTNLSGQVTSIRLITGTGELTTFNEQEHPEIMQALRVSVGSLGIFSRIGLRVLPAFQVYRQHWCASVNDCITHLPTLMEENRNFGFYWYPRRDEVSIRLWNIPGKGSQHLPYARLDHEETGWGKDLLPTPHELRYHELEYSFPIERAAECFLEIRERILKKHRKHVGWRALFRPVAGDDNYLSNSYGQTSVAITVHQNASLPYEEYFNDIEQIFQGHGGRPHWGKIHSMTSKQLENCYPEWDKFQRIREKFDPKGIFLTPYLKRIFID